MGFFKPIAVVLAGLLAAVSITPGFAQQRNDNNAKGGVPNAARPGPKAGGPGAGRPPAAPLIDRARALMDKGDFQGALIELDGAVKLDPKNSFVYAWRGLAFNRLNQHAQSIPEFDTSLKFEPKNRLALNGRGYAYLITGDNGKALADLNAAIAIAPDWPPPYNTRGLVYSAMGEQQRALKDLMMATRLNPELAEAYGSIGMVYLKLKQFEKAIVAYDQGIRINPNVARRFFGRGQAYQSLGESERALVDFNESVRLNPNFAPVLKDRGNVYLGRRDFAKAMADFDAALRLDPKMVGALLGRARAYEFTDQTDKALNDFEAALAISPEHGVAIAGRDRIKAKIAMAAGGSMPARDRAGGRVALVIGNSRYKTVDRLANAGRDAKLVADALGRSGFQTVRMLADGTRDGIEAELKAFAADAANADWAVVYYAGHGIEFDGSNFLVPVDAKYESDPDIPKESVALDEVLNAVGAAGKLRMVILDACRENPFAADTRGGGEARATGRGLARIEPESGTLVAFATKHGHVASDGSGENSPFATALVRRLSTPGLEINQIFRLVHDDVYAATEKKQEPFTYGQLSAEAFYFRTN